MAKKARTPICLKFVKPIRSSILYGELSPSPFPNFKKSNENLLLPNYLNKNQSNQIE